MKTRKVPHPGWNLEYLMFLFTRISGLAFFVLAIVGLLAALYMAAPAAAGSPIADVICDTREAMLLRLERNHGAEPQGRGIRSSDTILEIWAVPSTGEWTLVQSYASGKSCIVAMGEDWEMVAVPADPA